MNISSRAAHIEINSVIPGLDEMGAIHTQLEDVLIDLHSIETLLTSVCIMVGIFYVICLIRLFNYFFHD